LSVPYNILMVWKLLHVNGTEATKEILWTLYMSLRPSYFPLVFPSFHLVPIHEL